MNRALPQTAATAHTTEDTLIVVREVYQLVQEALTEPLHLSRTGLTGGHLGKVGIHAAVPAAETAHRFAAVKVLNVIALTGWADEGTGTAAKAAFGQRLPFRPLEKRLGFVGAKGAEVQLAKGQISRDIADNALHFFYRCLIGVLQYREGIRQCTTLFGVWLPIEESVCLPAGHISPGVCGVDAKGGAEAGLLRSATGQRYDASCGSALGIIAIRRLRPITLR